MKRIIKWAGGILGALIIVVLAALIFVYIKSSSVINKKFEITHKNPELSIPSDSISIKEGKRLALTMGCLDCHGENAEGEVMDEFGFSSILVAPNLTKSVAKYSRAELEQIIRHGIRPDRTSVIVMPSEQYQNISNKDLEKIIGFLESLPVTNNPELPELSLGPMARFIVATGETGPLSAYHINHNASHLKSTPKEPITEYGKYLVSRSCKDCHGSDLMGGQVGGHAVPPLTMVSGYSKQQFKRLLNTGVALGNRKLELMAETSKKRLQHFTDRELEAIYQYLSNWSDSAR